MDLLSWKKRYSNEKEVDWSTFVTKVTFVLYICGIKKYIDTEIIADQAARTYPDTFSMNIYNKKKVPDTYIIVMALKEAKSSKWRYVRGDWVKGWKLTQRGIQIAKDVERRTKKKSTKYKV